MHFAQKSGGTNLLTLLWGYGKSKEKDSGWMGDEGRLYHENGKEHSGACGILAGSACAGAALDRSGRQRTGEDGGIRDGKAGHDLRRG